MTDNNRPKDFRIYRASKGGSGVALSFQLSYKPDNQYDKFQCFLMAAMQGPDNSNGDATFLWTDKTKSTTVKLGDNDLFEMLSVLERRSESVGTKGSLYHATPSGGSKVINFGRTDKGYQLQISAQDTEKNVTRFSAVLSNAEAAGLAVLIKRAIEIIYNY